MPNRSDAAQQRVEGRIALVLRASIARALVASIASLAIASGCGSDGLPDMVPIQGKVTYNGEPLAEGSVVYLPASSGDLPGSSGGARQATGPIQPDGTFEMTSLKRGDGVMKGDYQIVVYAYEPHPGEPSSREDHEKMASRGEIQRGFLIPERYTRPETSGLRDKVDDDHSGFTSLELSDQ